jgi:4-hydroxy-tetrahydrodipicolinate reductase
MTLRVALIGRGRLGREIIALAPDRQVVIAAEFSRENPITLDALRTSAADVVLDVSTAAAVESNLAICLSAHVPIVLGVTGWYTDEARLRTQVEMAHGAVLAAPNFSIGAVLFSQIVADAARRCTAQLGFDAHIVETHHAAKLDAPSGTARRLGELASAERDSAVPITSVRVGHVPGIHTMVLDAPFEQITLTHEARDRRVFAHGALLAARWLHGKRGWFTMDDAVRDLTGGRDA